VGIVSCSEQAQFMLDHLEPPVRDLVEHRLDYLNEMPRLYALADDERFPGCRAFWVDPCYRVFYMVAAGGDDAHVLAIVEEEVDGVGVDPDL
jgi:hypothetical protein